MTYSRIPGWFVDVYSDQVLDGPFFIIDSLVPPDCQYVIAQFFTLKLLSGLKQSERDHQLNLATFVPLTHRRHNKINVKF